MPSMWPVVARVAMPGWQGAVAICLALAWRVAALAARGALDTGAPALDRWAVTKGAAWDIGLGLALLTLARAFALGLPTARAARWVAWLAGGCALTSAVLRAGDLVHCWLGRSHIPAEAFVYLEGGFGLVAIEPRILVLMAIVATVGTVQAWLTQRDVLAARARWDALAVAERRRLCPLLALALAGLLLPGGRALQDQFRWPPHEFEWRVVPEINFFRQLSLYRAERAGRLDVQLPSIGADVWGRWQRAGLVPPDTRPDDAFPLYRATLSEPPLPFAPVAGAPARPDIVLVLMESTDAHFVDGLGGPYLGLMPELGRFAAGVTAIHGWHNTTSPTIGGVVTSLCSVFPPAHTADRKDQAGVDASSRYLCLPEVLRAQGWRTVWVQGADLEGTGTGKFLRTHGFDEVWGPDDIRRRSPGAVFSRMGAHDRDTNDLVLAILTHLRAEQARDGRPFFLSLMNLDPHEPGLAPAGCGLPRHPDGRDAIANLPRSESARTALAAYHCADRELGRLLRAVMAPPWRDRTVVVVTSDHVAFRTPTNVDILAGAATGWSFGPIPMLLHDPLHALPRRLDVLAGTHDLAPTLLHLLGRGLIPTSMAGRSALGSRRDLPLLVGRIGRRLVWVHDGARQAEVPIGDLARRCAYGESVLATAEAGGIARVATGPAAAFARLHLLPGAGRVPAPDACDLDLWLRWQDALWALRRVSPVP
ncbi:MAG: LTA synthase family protein [Myxococcales bacterium]|nr:LTA synthase family protein [Myxococcales bacterium]